MCNSKYARPKEKKNIKPYVIIMEYEATSKASLKKILIINIERVETSKKTIEFSTIEFQDFNTEKVKPLDLYPINSNENAEILR